MKRILFLSIIILAGCGKNDDAPVPAPGKATLVFPAQNAACTTGNDISASASVVTLTWNTATNVTHYQLVIKNLLTHDSIVKTVSTNQSTDTLLQNTPYSWYVNAVNSLTTVMTKSDVWKFYMSGPGQTSFAPFPATLTSPAFGQTLAGTTVNLTWTGSDPDNDISSYDVYLGTSANPPLLQGNISNAFLNNVTIRASTTYHWKIVTHDAAGNIATSDVFRFQVQ